MNEDYMKSAAAVFALSLLTIVSVVPAALAQEKKAERVEAQQWEVCDLSFSVEEDALSDKPIDTEFTATFENAQDERLVVPGFYNGDHSFVVRFTPPSAGDWHYFTRSAEDALDDRTGKVIVKPAAADRKGDVIPDRVRMRLVVRP